MSLVPDVQRVRDNLSKQEQKIFDAVVSMAERVNPSFQNRIQWQKPTFTLNDNWHHWIFSLSKTKMGMTLAFHKGWLLDDPQKILGGDGKHLRMLRFTDASQIQQGALKTLIREAVKHQLDL
jgi:hypothetical protein